MTQMPPLPDMILEPLVRAALIEDLGTFGDITTRTVIPAGTRYTARIRAREAGVASRWSCASIARMARVLVPATRWLKSRVRRPRSCRPSGWR